MTRNTCDRCGDEIHNAHTERDAEGNPICLDCFGDREETGGPKVPSIEELDS
jgi:formylmethanofuran dehydrogenase subunit E